MVSDYSDAKDHPHYPPVLPLSPGLSPKELVLLDFKKFTVGPTTFGWGALETVDTASVVRLEAELRYGQASTHPKLASHPRQHKTC